MSKPIETAAFSGHQGLVVVRDSGTVGELDAGDEVRALVTDQGGRGRVDASDVLGEPVSWDDPRLSAARASFERLSAGISSGGATIKGLAEAPKAVRLRDKEAELTAVTRAADAVGADASPRLRSDAWLLRAGADGIRLKLTGFDPLKVSAIQGWGASAVKALDAAVREDPSYAFAWTSFGMTVLGVYATDKPWRGLAEGTFKEALGQSAGDLDTLARRIAMGLMAHGSSPADLTTLDLLVRVLEREGQPLPSSYAPAIARQRAELARLRADPANAAEFAMLDDNSKDLRATLP